MSDVKQLLEQATSLPWRVDSYRTERWMGPQERKRYAYVRLSKDRDGDYTTSPLENASVPPSVAYGVSRDPHGGPAAGAGSLGGDAIVSIHKIAARLTPWTFGYMPGTFSECLVCQRTVVYVVGAKRMYWKHVVEPVA
jgi:hypothetical protein